MTGGTKEVHIGQRPPARAVGAGSLRVLSGFAFILVAGTGLLLLPVSTVEGRETTAMDALFTAVSALCVTGLVLFDTQEQWTFFGEMVILLLIQIGGLGYMLGTTVVLWALGRQLGLRDRHMLRLYHGAPSLGQALSFARNIALYAATVELAGAAVLWVLFVGNGESPATSAWWSLFHSVSAFNNAGFSVTGRDFIGYNDDPAMLLTLSSLVILGSLGAIPVLALARVRSWTRLPLDAKLVFLTTGVLLAGGTAAVLGFEWTNDATLGAVGAEHRPALAFFQSTMPRTAGFSAIDIPALRDETKFFMIPLMFIGGAAGSTAGGIKVGTFSLLLVALVATLRSRDEAVVLRREIPQRVIRQALAIALIGVATVVVFALALTVATDDAFIDALFDVVSALGTVGLAAGSRWQEDIPAQVILMLAMLVGRFGPLVLVLEMNRRRRRSTYRVPEDSIRLG